MLTEYVNGDSENSKNQELCLTMKNYIYYNYLNTEKAVISFYSELNKGKNKPLRDIIQQRYEQNGCKFTIKDYKDLNKKLNLMKFKPDKMKCDMILPALPGLTENTKLCDSLGQYLLQFDIDPYTKFYQKKVAKWREVEGNDQKSKTNYIAQEAIKVYRNNKIKFLKNSLKNAAKVALDVYYEHNCLDIIDDYNTFNEMFNNNDGKIMVEALAYNEKCDYFKRLQPTNVMDTTNGQDSEAKSDS